MILNSDKPFNENAYILDEYLGTIQMLRNQYLDRGRPLVTQTATKTSSIILFQIPHLSVFQLVIP